MGPPRSPSPSRVWRMARLRRSGRARPFDGGVPLAGPPPLATGPATIAWQHRQPRAVGCAPHRSPRHTRRCRTAGLARRQTTVRTARVTGRPRDRFRTCVVASCFPWCCSEGGRRFGNGLLTCAAGTAARASLGLDGDHTTRVSPEGQGGQEAHLERASARWFLHPHTDGVLDTGAATVGGELRRLVVSGTLVTDRWRPTRCRCVRIRRLQHDRATPSAMTRLVAGVVPSCIVSPISVMSSAHDPVSFPPGMHRVRAVCISRWPRRTTVDRRMASLLSSTHAASDNNREPRADSGNRKTLSRHVHVLPEQWERIARAARRNALSGARLPVETAIAALARRELPDADARTAVTRPCTATSFSVFVVMPPGRSRSRSRKPDGTSARRRSLSRPCPSSLAHGQAGG